MADTMLEVARKWIIRKRHPVIIRYGGEPLTPEEAAKTWVEVEAGKPLSLTFGVLQQHMADFAQMVLERQNDIYSTMLNQMEMSLCVLIADRRLCSKVIEAMRRKVKRPTREEVLAALRERIGKEK